MDADRSRRRQIFAALSPRFGKLVPAAFLKNPGLPGVERIHPLTEGIHKPAWSNYALSITTMLKSPYHDQTHFNIDGTWWMHYSPKAGSLDIAVNAAMVRCMTDSEPLLVLKQIADSSVLAWSRTSTTPPNSSASAASPQTTSPTTSIPRFRTTYWKRPSDWKPWKNGVPSSTKTAFSIA